MSGEAATAATANLEADLEVGFGAGLKAGLETTAAHVFDGVAGGVGEGVRGAVGAAFDVIAAFDVAAAFGGLLGGVSMLLIADNESFGASGAGGGGEVDVGASFGASDCFFA